MLSASFDNENENWRPRVKVRRAFFQLQLFIKQFFTLFNVFLDLSAIGWWREGEEKKTFYDHEISERNDIRVKKQFFPNNSNNASAHYYCCEKVVKLLLVFLRKKEERNCCCCWGVVKSIEWVKVYFCLRQSIKFQLSLFDVFFSRLRFFFVAIIDS
jgi:hypothetical protein